VKTDYLVVILFAIIDNYFTFCKDKILYLSIIAKLTGLVI